MATPPTPRTDALERDGKVPAEFARRLERRLARERENYRNLLARINEHVIFKEKGCLAAEVNLERTCKELAMEENVRLAVELEGCREEVRFLMRQAEVKS